MVRLLNHRETFEPAFRAIGKISYCNGLLYTIIATRYPIWQDEYEHLILSVIDVQTATESAIMPPKFGNTSHVHCGLHAK